MTMKLGLLLVLTGMFAANLAAAARVGTLRCESRIDPQGIDVSQPQLSWIIESDRRGEIQTAYQILVASTPELLDENRGDLWDSGRVNSDATAQIQYAGKTLTSASRCFWKVRVWDRDAKPSAWSQPAQWSMGLLNAADWTARWISDPILADPANRPLTPIHCFRSELAARPDSLKWIVLDLGSSRRMDALDLMPARPPGQHSDFRTAMFPVRFKVEAADTRDFATAFLLVDHTSTDCPDPRGNSCRFQFPPVTARYVRLTVTRLAKWDGQEYGLALGGVAVFDGPRSIAVGAGVECADSVESAAYSKNFLVDGKPAVELTDSPALDAGMPDAYRQATVSRVPMLRREFNLGGKIRRATLFVSARGFYEMRINGSRVSQDLLAPGFTDYNTRIAYQSYDVTALLRQGPNAIAALLGYGWYAGHVNLFEMRCIYGYFPQLLAQLNVELADGSRVTIGTDGQWRSTLDGPVRWSDLLDGEGYDCNRELPGWDQPRFDDRAWKPAWSQPRDSVPLVWDRCQPVRVIRDFRPLAVTEPKPGVYVLDFGQEFTGRCRLKTAGPAGAHVRLRHSEMIGTDGNIDVTSLAGTLQQEDYILDGKPERILEPHFTYHGFRYVELSGLPGPLKPDTLIAVNTRTSAEQAGQFECSNPLFNRIQRAAVWTAANLMFDLPNGCAARSERVAWMGDIRPCVPSLLLNFDAAPLLSKYVIDIRDAQTPDGRFTDIAPHAHLTGTRVCVGSPGWADAGVSLPWDLYLATGDKRMLAEHFESASRWVDAIHKTNPDLLWRNDRGQDWGDWLSAGPETPRLIGSTAFFAHSADLLSRMAKALGRRQEADQYHALFQGIRQAFAKHFVSPAGIITDDTTTGAAGGHPADTQGSYALALQFGLLDEPLKSLAASRLHELVIENYFHPTTGFWSSSELLQALSNTGYQSDAAAMVNQRDEPSWGAMAELNTTFWESFDADKRKISLNHWPHSAVSCWLWRNVAGLSPDEQNPGYRCFIICPHPTKEVTWCSAKYDSIRGEIVINWRQDGKTFKLAITIPANTTANVRLPATELHSILESGRLVQNAEGVRYLRTEYNRTVFQVASGTYDFTCQGK